VGELMNIYCAIKIATSGSSIFPALPLRDPAKQGPLPPSHTGLSVRRHIPAWDGDATTTGYHQPLEEELRSFT
jgi:hypothetical protein